MIRRWGQGAPQGPNTVTGRVRAPIGAPQRDPNTQPPSQGPVSGPNSTRYRATIHQFGKVQPVVDVAGYPGGSQTLNFTVGPVSILAINRAAQNQLRSMLMMRNSASSPAGSNLFVAFGTAAADVSAWFEIPPGGIILLDAKVPQDDVWIAGSVAGVNAVLGYNVFPVQF